MLKTAALFSCVKNEIVRQIPKTIIISDNHKNLYNLFPCISTHYYMYWILSSFYFSLHFLQIFTWPCGIIWASWLFVIIHVIVHTMDTNSFHVILFFPLLFHRRKKGVEKFFSIFIIWHTNVSQCFHETHTRRNRLFNLANTSLSFFFF